MRQLAACTWLCALGVAHALHDGCRWNLTQPHFKTYTEQPGAGWLEGHRISTVFNLASHIDLGAQDINGIQRPKSFPKSSWK
jgi:hypothetical protein